MELSFSLDLPQDAASVPVVRHVCRDALTQLGVDEECVDDMCLAVTEACSNVLRHATARGSEYQVGVQIDRSNCRIAVSDAGLGFEPEEVGLQTSPASSEGGRGIFLMRALVDEISYADGDDQGTSVLLLKKLKLREDSLLGRLVRD